LNEKTTLRSKTKEKIMKVFVTGATGFIGFAVVKELLGTGHQVLGMTRSEAGAQSLIDAGAEAHLGTLEDLDSIKRGAAASDGVIHLAFDHDFSHFVENCEKDRRVIEALGSALEGTERPLIITSGVGMGSAGPGQAATEDIFNPNNPNPRVLSEVTGNQMLAAGVSVSVVRLPQVHDTVKQGLLTPLIAITREKGVSAYVGDGSNRLSAAHVSDVARLYGLALEKHEAGARYNAVAEEGVPMREIAEVIGRGLKVPAVSISQAEVGAHFGWMGMFADLDLAASSAITREKLGWNPTGPGLIADLKQMDYGS
jgi:nucleoside-diphosphate-sugar epimerase